MQQCWGICSFLDFQASERPKQEIQLIVEKLRFIPFNEVYCYMGVCVYFSGMYDPKDLLNGLPDEKKIRMKLEIHKFPTS